MSKTKLYQRQYAAGVQAADIAREHGVSRQAVNNALARHPNVRLLRAMHSQAKASEFLADMERECTSSDRTNRAS